MGVAYGALQGDGELAREILFVEHLDGDLIARAEVLRNRVCIVVAHELVVERIRLLLKA